MPEGVRQGGSAGRGQSGPEWRTGLSLDLPQAHGSLPRAPASGASWRWHRSTRHRPRPHPGLGQAMHSDLQCLSLVPERPHLCVPAVPRRVCGCGLWAQRGAPGGLGLRGVSRLQEVGLLAGVGQLRWQVGAPTSHNPAVTMAQRGTAPGPPGEPASHQVPAVRQTPARAVMPPPTGMKATPCGRTGSRSPLSDPGVWAGLAPGGSSGQEKPGPASQTWQEGGPCRCRGGRRAPCGHSCVEGAEGASLGRSRTGAESNESKATEKPTVTRRWQTRGPAEAAGTRACCTHSSQTPQEPRVFPRPPAAGPLRSTE